MANIEQQDQTTQKDAGAAGDASKEQTTLEASKTTQVKPQTKGVTAQTQVNVNTEQAVDLYEGLTDSEKTDVQLVEALLAEYTSSITPAHNLSDANAKATFGKLHGAFRSMMAMRGKAHVKAAHAFLAAFREHGKGSLNYNMRCRHIDLMPREQRTAFTAYLDLLSRFAKTENKAAFRKNNDIERLTSKILDQSLREAINSVFPG